MKINAIRSEEIYRKMMSATEAEKEDLYRYELMKPFEEKWKLFGIPLKAETKGGYDIVAHTNMTGEYTPIQITNEREKEIEAISNTEFWKACEDSIRNSLESFEKNGITLRVQDYIFTILLSNPNHPMTAMTGDYCGDGGIPGFITGTIIPNEKSLNMMPVALAHEANHNVRWQFMQWSPNITLADMIVSEGLAENFAAMMYGEDKVGRWVSETSEETLSNVIKPMIKEHLQEADFQKVTSYLYGDTLAAVQGGTPIGMPYCGGYACGYALVKHYIQKTGNSLFEATITNTDDIMKETEDFWEK